MPDQPADHSSPESKHLADSTEYPGPRRTPAGEVVDPSTPQSDVTPGTGARSGRPSATSAGPGEGIGTPSGHDMMPPLPQDKHDDAPHAAKAIPHGGSPEDESGI